MHAGFDFVQGNPAARQDEVIAMNDGAHLQPLVKVAAR